MHPVLFFSSFFHFDLNMEFGSKHYHAMALIMCNDLTQGWKKKKKLVKNPYEPGFFKNHSPIAVLAI